jgi:hypothetical protein
MNDGIKFIKRVQVTGLSFHKFEKNKDKISLGTVLNC